MLFGFDDNIFVVGDHTIESPISKLFRLIVVDLPAHIVAAPEALGLEVCTTDK
jgi:hypothetical protein